jgi:hypothetical protein
MPKINFLNLLLWSNLVLLILSSESVIYDEKTVEEMKSSLWNSNSEGFYYLDFHPIRDNETIIALTSIEKKDEQSKGYTDIITYEKKVNEDGDVYYFYLYQYNKENLNFGEPTELFRIQDESIESVRNLYVGKFTGDQKGFLVSFHKKYSSDLIHYLTEEKKGENAKQLDITSNILILNRNAKNESQILYQDNGGIIRICRINKNFECEGKNDKRTEIADSSDCLWNLKGGLAYVDVDGNCSPDIIIGCNKDIDGMKRIIRIYSSIKKDDKYHLAQSLNIGNADDFGPFIISRIKNKRDPSIAPQLDILVPLTNSTDKIELLGLKNIIEESYKWEDKYCDDENERADNTGEKTIFEKDGIYELKESDKKIKGFDIGEKKKYNGMALMRPGDFLSSGTPGILVRERIKDDNGNEKPAISLYEKTDDGFNLYLRVYGDKVGNPKNGIFFDINESGSLGLIIQNEENKTHFIYNYRKNAFFVKTKLMNDLKNYYDSNVGATFRYIATDSDGDRYMDISYQLAQTSDNNIPLPFSLVGLGDTSNYVEYFEIISGNYYQDKELFDDDEYRNYKTQTPIVPNTQMAVFKYINEDSKYEWHLDLFVLPTDSLLIIALVIVVVMLIILGVIIYLHVREVKEVQKETNKFKSWFA